MTERGYQGELLGALQSCLAVQAALPEAIFEQEHQKVFGSHGINIRPDVILHEPFDTKRHGSRREGNYAVIELKRRSSANAASEDFASIEHMFQHLDYRLGAFINIDAEQTYGDLLPQSLRGFVSCFAVMLDRDGRVVVRESNG